MSIFSPASRLLRSENFRAHGTAARSTRSIPSEQQRILLSRGDFLLARCAHRSAICRRSSATRPIGRRLMDRNPDLFHADARWRDAAPAATAYVSGQYNDGIPSDSRFAVHAGFFKERLAKMQGDEGKREIEKVKLLTQLAEKGEPSHATPGAGRVAVPSLVPPLQRRHAARWPSRLLHVHVPTPGRPCPFLCPASWRSCISAIPCDPAVWMLSLI